MLLYGNGKMEMEMEKNIHWFEFVDFNHDK